MGDDWRKQYESSKNGFAHPNAPDASPGAGSFWTQSFDWDSPVPHPNSPDARWFDWSMLPGYDTYERASAVYEAIKIGVRQAPRAMIEATGEELRGIQEGLALMFVATLAWLGLCGGVGFLAGAALGALLGAGVGAIPAGAAGASVGVEGGLFVLELLGLGFLIGYIGTAVVNAVTLATRGAKQAWNSVDMARAYRRVHVEAAGKLLAAASAELWLGILQGVVAYLLAGGQANAFTRVKDLTKLLKQGRLGAEFAGWVESRWELLLKNPKLQPKPIPEAAPHATPGAGADEAAAAATKPKPTTQSKPQAKPQAKPEPKPEPKVEPKAEPKPKPAAPAAASAMETSIQNKRVSPSSLEEAQARLAERRAQIAKEGYKPKYTDEELHYLAKNGNVGEERFQVRFMEKQNLDRANKVNPEDTLGGTMGRPMKGETGEGAKYWSTSFDQIEDADSDARIIAEKLGLKYEPGTEYTMVIVDNAKAKPITDVKSVPATFDQVGEFSNKELPADFSKEFTDKTMTPEFQEAYKQHHEAAFGDDLYGTDAKKFDNYLQGTDLSAADQEAMLQRLEMQKQIGNNRLYTGNGLTEDVIKESPNKYGAVETLNFERKPTNLKQLNDVGAIKVLNDVTPVQQPAASTSH